MGIITISTRDSFSKFMSLVCDNVYTTIGIYCPASINGNNFICLHLYNIWENTTPIWVKYFMQDKLNPGYIDLNDIINYKLVDKIIKYPVKNEYKNRFKIYLSKIIALEDNKNVGNCFEWLLSHMTGTVYKGDAVITGYDIVNYIIKMLDNPSCSKPNGTMSLITPNPLMSPDRKNNIVGCKSIDSINKNELFTNQLDLLTDTFKDMFNKSDIFQSKLAELKHNTLLKDYIDIEDNLFSCMSRGLSCKDMIESLNKIRDKTGGEIMTQEQFYDDKRDNIAKELINFRQDLNKLISNINNNTTPIIIYIDKFLEHYNNLCNILDITQLDIPEIHSASAIITTDQSVDLDINDGYITIQASRLDRFTKEELREILKTINEISIVDAKYIALQNSIAQELSNRI